VCFRRLPSSMQDIIKHSAARNRRVSQQVMKVTIKTAQAYLRDRQ
jgi:hypothetical protein